MKTERILEMINKNEIKELKKILQDEIYTSNINANPGQKKRYAAMKKFYKYVTQKNPALLSPLFIKSSIGLCFVFPIIGENIEEHRTIIEAMEI